MDNSLKREISDYVQKHEEAQLRFLIDLCNQNSYTHNAEGTDRVAEMVLEKIARFFPKHERTEQPEVGSHHVLSSETACMDAASGSTYLLGHLDTVFPPNHAFQKCTLEGEWLRGPGTGDMKGGLAVVVYAIRSLAHLGLMDKLNLTLVLGADEEIGSAMSHKRYEVEAERACACLAAECAGPRGEFVISRNGKAGARLECFGREGHVSSVGKEKSSAILEIARRIVALENLNENFPDASVNVGTIRGGLGPATVPGYASCQLDLRWARDESCESLLEEVESIVRDEGQFGCRCQFTIINHRPAMPASDRTDGMLRTLEKCAESLGLPFATEHRRGTSDANFFGAAGVPTVDGFGPVCVGDHTPDEKILLASLPERTALLALFLTRLRSRTAGRLELPPRGG